MAKSDIAKNGKIFFKGNKYRQNAFKITMSQIECAERKKMPEQKGIRQIVLDAYKEKGYMGAMIALKVYNDKIKRKFPDKDKQELQLYTIEQLKSWISEYEEKNKGETRD